MQFTLSLINQTVFIHDIIIQKKKVSNYYRTSDLKL